MEWVIGIFSFVFVSVVSFKIGYFLGECKGYADRKRDRLDWKQS